MEWFRCTWQRLTHVDKRDELPLGEQRHQTFVNGFCLVATMLLIGLLPIALAIDHPALTRTYLWFILPGGALYLVSLYLNRRGHFFAAVSLLGVTALAIVYGAMWILGQRASPHAYVLLWPALVPLIYGRRYLVWGVGHVIAAAGLLVLFLSIGPAQPSVGEPYTDDIATALRVFNLGASFVLLMVLGLLGRKIMMNAEDELETERRRSEDLLLNVLPASIAERLKDEPGTIAERFDEAIAEMALDMLETISAVDAPDGHKLDIRVGFHTGPVVAGVIGHRKFSYDVWGDTVNLASRLESHGAEGRIHVSAEVRAALANDYDFEPRGKVSIRGKGDIDTYWLLGRKSVARDQAHAAG